MPVAGRKPKPDGQKRNRVKSAIDWVDVVDVSFVGGPKLPRREQGWPTRTKRWWTVISAMPHCVLWSDADWEFAIDTALLAAEFHAGDMRVAPELRQREKILGTTMDARRDLRIRYVTRSAEVEGAGDVTNLDDYRDALA
jgi:hypothetical protein